MMNFGKHALHSVAGLAAARFTGARARAFMAGLGVHSIINPEQKGSAAAGLVLAIAAHVQGWPLPEGGAQKLIDALVKALNASGGNIEVGTEVKSIIKYPPDNILFLDVTPQQFLDITEGQLPVRYKHKLENYRYGPAVFKIDWILDGPVPWKANECASAGTVHIGGGIEEILASENDIHRGKHPERPFVLLVQPCLFDKSRSTGSDHIVWGYCHVPNSSTVDMTDKIESQVERFAPGFKDRIRARHVMYPLDIEKGNPNCVGGDIAAGAQSLAKMILPGISYETPLDNVFLCSAATPPGPGVHGMCGFRAAQCGSGRAHLSALAFSGGLRLVDRCRRIVVDAFLRAVRFRLCTRAVESAGGRAARIARSCQPLSANPIAVGWR